MIKIPVNCEAMYDEVFLPEEEADSLFKEILENYDVTNDVIRMADGSEFVGEVGSYLFADEELTGFDQLPEVWGARSAWPASLKRIRDRIETVTGTRFHVARAIYYRDGGKGMDFHRDYPAYGPTDKIASISLGAEREFVLRPLDSKDPAHHQILKHGSLFLMGEHCQDRYEHGIPRGDVKIGPRINLTFRKFERLSH